MRRRILTAIVGVTVLATTVLTIPLMFVFSSRARDRGVHELERIAERFAPDVTPGAINKSDDFDFPDMDDDATVGVYLPDGTKVAGRGPNPGGDLITDVRFTTRNAKVGSSLVIARPVVNDETTVGVIRVAEPLSETVGRARRDQGFLLLVDLIAVAIATAAGFYVTSRLVRPIERIRDDAVRLGKGDFAIPERTSGISELDAISTSMADTAERLDSMLLREREFTANASHQLRTPLTALRLAIEGELMAPRNDSSLVLEESLGEVERLEATINTLLRVARRRTTNRLLLDFSDWTETQGLNWRDVEDAGRPVQFRTLGTEPVKVSREVLDVICDVLVDNALQHGAGTVNVTINGESGSVTLSVADEGAMERDPADLFVRNDPGAAGNGIGLALARSLAEGEGGRLVVASTHPTEFRVILPDWSDADWGNNPSRP